MKPDFKKEILGDQAMPTPDFTSYLEKPVCCPHCQGSSMLYHNGKMSFKEDVTLVLPAECRDCRKSWSDYYTLTGIYDPETGETHTGEKP